MKNGLGLGVDRYHLVSGIPIIPETIDYMAALGIADDSTIYFSSTPQQITGSAMWTAVNMLGIRWKTALGLPLTVNNLSTKIDTLYPFMGGTAATCKFNYCNLALHVAAC